MIPAFSKLPGLFGREHGATPLAPLLTPALNMLFRPEQENGFSREDNVFVPLMYRQEEMDHRLDGLQFPVLNREGHPLVTARAAGDNLAILIKCCEHSQSVPNAVCPPALFANSDFKRRGHSAEGRHSPNLAALAPCNHGMRFAEAKQRRVHFSKRF